MVRKMPWYKRYPSNALTGKLGLTLEQRGAYDTLIDLCYDRGGPVLEDEGELARIAHCTRRRWRRVLEQLIEKDKVRRIEGGLIVRGFRHGSDEFRDVFDEKSDKDSQNSAKNRAKNRETRPSSQPKSTGYGSSTNPPRARASQSPESRVQNRAPFDPQIVTAFCSELGVEFDPNGNQGNWPSILQRMIDEDHLDLELDILAAVRTCRAAGRLPVEIRTPGFFRSDARRLADLRKSGKPVATIHVIGPKAEEMTRVDWKIRLRRFLECGIWIGPGADPTCLACIAPADMLEQARRSWVELGNHPEFADTDCNFPWQPEGPRMRGVIWPAVKALEVEARQA